MRLAALRAILCVAGLGACVGGAAADEFYKGKQLDFISSSAVGGGYDAYARLIARHVGKPLGARNVVVQNMPGAGGIKSAQYLYNTAPKTGLTIGMLINNTPFTPLYDGKDYGFDATKYIWLGSPNRETPVMFVWHTVPVHSIADAQKREVILGTTGPTSTAAFYGRVLAEVLHLKIKAVHGYKGQPEALNAMEKGEVEGYSSAMWSTMRSSFPQWLSDKKVTILVQYGASRDPEVGDVPYLGDLVQDPADRALVDVAVAAFGLGRPTLAPPGTAPERVSVLRAAMMATFADAAFQEDCVKLRFDCERPSTGDELAAIVDKAYAMSPDVLTRLRRMTNAQD